MTMSQFTNYKDNETLLAPISKNVINQIQTLIKAYWHTGFFMNWWNQYPQVSDTLNVYTVHYIRYHENEFDFSVDNAENCDMFDADTGYRVSKNELINRINQYCKDYHFPLVQTK